MERQQRSRVGDYLSLCSQVIAGLDKIAIATIAEELVELWKNGGTLFLCGNGGSAALANHLAVDLTKCINTGLKLGYIDRGQRFRAVSLAASVELLTCLGNDLGYPTIFAEQVETLANPGDVLLVISGSGNSPNILEAAKTARMNRMDLIAFTGFDGGKLLAGMDFSAGTEFSLHVPVNDMQMAEDAFHVAAHALFREVMTRIEESLSLDEEEGGCELEPNVE